MKERGKGLIIAIVIIKEILIHNLDVILSFESKRTRR
jgi:hypothetical protein